MYPYAADARVTIAMTSFYRNEMELRCQQTAEIIRDATRAGYQTVIVDGSPNPAVGKYLRELGALVFPQQEPGMGASRREVFAWAKAHLGTHRKDEVRIIVWTEEKPFIVEQIPRIIKPILNNGYVGVIAKRSEESFHTWPQFQAESEQQANAAYNEATRRDSDPMFGPVAFDASHADIFSNCHPERYGVPAFAAGYIQHFGMLEIMMEGFYQAAWFVADSEPLDVVYPPAQRKEEETALISEMLEKRRRQMEELSEGYRIAALALDLNREWR